MNNQGFCSALQHWLFSTWQGALWCVYVLVYVCAWQKAIYEITKACIHCQIETVRLVKSNERKSKAMETCRLTSTFPWDYLRQKKHRSAKYSLMSLCIGQYDEYYVPQKLRLYEKLGFFLGFVYFKHIQSKLFIFSQQWPTGWSVQHTERS